MGNLRETASCPLVFVLLIGLFVEHCKRKVWNEVQLGKTSEGWQVLPTTYVCHCLSKKCYWACVMCCWGAWKGPRLVLQSTKMTVFFFSHDFSCIVCARISVREG